MTAVQKLFDRTDTLDRSDLSDENVQKCANMLGQAAIAEMATQIASGYVAMPDSMNPKAVAQNSVEIAQDILRRVNEL